MPLHHWFSERLLNWYADHSRPLPWRATSDPYKVWLSEVILQQTRVAQGMAYYERFVKQYQTVADLADSPQDEVMKLWQGLGYYSRARNLHKAAKLVHEEHGGVFPTSSTELKQLPGIGDYTAAAIASICFDEPAAVVDGNVLRVLSRVFGIDTPIDTTAGRKQFNQLANEALDQQHPGDHNQAVMEFGALHCTPKQPKCADCIFNDKCSALSTGNVDLLPVKQGKTKQRDRYFNYLVIQQEDQTLMEQRQGQGIWEGLYQFPLVETDRKVGWATLLKHLNHGSRSRKGLQLIADLPVHVLSHQRIYARFWRCDLDGIGDHFPKANWVDPAKLEKLPVPRLIDKFMQTHPQLAPG